MRRQKKKFKVRHQPTEAVLKFVKNSAFSPSTLFKLIRISSITISCFNFEATVLIVVLAKSLLEIHKKLCSFFSELLRLYSHLYSSTLQLLFVVGFTAYQRISMCFRFFILSSLSSTLSKKSNLHEPVNSLNTFAIS